MAHTHWVFIVAPVDAVVYPVAHGVQMQLSKQLPIAQARNNDYNINNNDDGDDDVNDGDVNEDLSNDDVNINDDNINVSDDQDDDDDDDIIIVPHVVVVGKALLPMVLVVVGFQSLIHVNGHP